VNLWQLHQSDAISCAAMLFLVFGVEQISFICKVSLVCTSKYEAEHSEKSIDFPTLDAVPTTCIN
jgi:hypothetical protein